MIVFMEEHSNNEKRKYPRFHTDLDIRFQVEYDLDTKIEFQKIDTDSKEALSDKRSAISKNVSVEGLCFRSHSKLKEGDKLRIDVYIPKVVEPVQMIGDVRWSQDVYPQGPQKEYLTGVKVNLVNGKNVSETIFIDKSHHIAWSDVLELTVGEYRIASREDKEE